MRLLVAAPEYGRLWGGIGSYLGQLLQGLGGKHEFTILSGGGASTPRARTVPLTNGGGVMANYARFQVALRRRLPKLVAEHRPDALLVHHAQMPDLLTTSPVPVVVTTHTTIRGQSQGAWAARRTGSPLDGSERTTLAALPALFPAEFYYWRRARHALFVSGAVRQEVESGYAPHLETAATVPNGIDVAGTAARAHLAGLQAPGPYLLFSGRLLGLKGLAILLRALRSVSPELRLLVAGSGDVAAWQRYAASLGVPGDRVRFLGGVPHDRLLPLLAGAEQFLLPSFTESCPYSLLEAMAVGTPTVASAVPGVRAMVEDGVSARLVPPGNPEALARAVNALHEDASLRHRLGAGARDRAAREYSLARMCAATEGYLARVAS